MEKLETKPLVVVQNNLVERLTEPVAIAAHKMSITLHDLSAGDLTKIPRVPPDGAWFPILVIGSIAFTKQWIDQRPDLREHIYWTDEHYDAALWKEKLGKHFLNSDGYSSTIGEFIASDHDKMHIRPRSEIKMVGDKIKSEDHAGQESIAGMVTTPADLKERNIDNDLTIWVSPPQEIIAEIRVWMIGGEVAAASIYRLFGQNHISNGGGIVGAAMDFAERCHGIWHPDYHYVVDVAISASNPCQIIEYNPIHSSGWYAAEPKDIIRAFMIAEVIKQWQPVKPQQKPMSPSVTKTLGSL